MKRINVFRFLLVAYQEWTTRTQEEYDAENGE